MPAIWQIALTDTSAGSLCQYAVIATSRTVSAFIVRGLPRAGFGSSSLILLPVVILYLDGAPQICVPLGNVTHKQENDLWQIPKERSSSQAPAVDSAQRRCALLPTWEIASGAR